MQTIQEKVGFGKMLQKARDTAGFSQQEIAEKLRLDLKLIQALEQEGHKNLPAAAYVRGYLRAYAQLLECDADNILQQYNLSADQDPALFHNVPVEPHHQRNRKPVALRGFLILVLLVLGLISVWVVDVPKLIHLKDSALSTATEELEPNIISQQEAAMVEFAAAENDSGEEQLSAVSFSEELKSENEFNNTSGLAAESSNELFEGMPQRLTINTLEEDKTAFDISSMPDRQDIVLKAPYGDDHLTVNFNGACWVEAVDANGFRLLFGLFNQADDALTVKGQAPFQIILGNAHFVNVKVNERAFELNSYIRSNNTARVLITKNAEYYQD